MFFKQSFGYRDCDVKMKCYNELLPFNRSLSRVPMKYKECYINVVPEIGITNDLEPRLKVKKFLDDWKKFDIKSMKRNMFARFGSGYLHKIYPKSSEITHLRPKERKTPLCNTMLTYGHLRYFRFRVEPPLFQKRQKCFITPWGYLRAFKVT